MLPEFKRAGAMQEGVLGRSYWSETLSHCLNIIALSRASGEDGEEIGREEEIY